MHSNSKILEKIEELRAELTKTVYNNELTNERTIILSQKLDYFLNMYDKNRKSSV